MVSPPRQNGLLAPKDILRKRPSNEAIDNADRKKSHVGIETTARTTAPVALSDHQARDLRISPDPDDHPAFQQSEYFIPKTQDFQETQSRRGARTVDVGLLLSVRGERTNHELATVPILPS